MSKRGLKSCTFFECEGNSAGGIRDCPTCVSVCKRDVPYVLRLCEHYLFFNVESCRKILSTICYLDGHVCVDCARVCALNQDDFSLKTREWIGSISCSSNAVPPTSMTITAAVEFDDEIGDYDPFKRKELFRS
jgi:hypothetical protein